MSPSERLQYSDSLLSIQFVDVDIDYAEKAQSADFETAIHYSKYGKFQYVLLFICGIVYATCAISTTTLSFVLPSAECDFDLSSADKGKLSAMPLIGMIFGCNLWGSVAEARGRKLALILSLLIDFIAALSSSFAQTFNAFLICRFFNGFGIIGATSLIFSYLGEFLSKKHTDKMLGKLEIFWNVGIILLPGLAWTLLKKSSMDIFKDYGNFSPWRIFVAACSLPSLISLVLLYFLPETPKYLLSKGRHEEAINVFRYIFSFNTGHCDIMYPVITLEGEGEDNNNSVEQLKVTFRQKIYKRWCHFKRTINNFFGQQYIKYLVIACFADFGLMASYYTLIMWFPEIFERFNQFKRDFPNRTVTVCTASQSDIIDPSLNDFIPCDPSIANTVFYETIIIGLSCIPTSVSLSYFMEKMGKKMVLIIGMLLSGVAAVSLLWVEKTSHTLIVSCIFEALTSILETVLFCVVVDIFPTNIRAIALSLTATSGRVGAIFGNVIFGLLIDLNCVIPIYLFGCMLIGSGILCYFLPRTESYETLQ